MRWPPGIRVRLAASFTTLVAVLLVLVGVATYQLLRQSLLAEIERDVAARAVALSKTARAVDDLDGFGAPDVFIQVVDDKGGVTARSGNLDGRVLPLPDGARRGMVVEVHVAGRPLFLTAAPISEGRYVVVARSPMTTYGALRTLSRLLAAVVVVAVLLTALASWLYARAALRPIDRVVEAARAVRDSRDLTRRVRLGPDRARVRHRGPPDEVGRLTETFNEMLAELADANRSLDESNQQLRRFLADCSHELRAPLARIRSTADVAVRAEEDDEGTAFRSRALADIAAETDRMAGMVRQLLILARADAGATIEPRPVPLGQVLESAVRKAERMAGEMTLVPPPDGALAEVTVLGNADYLEQIVLILVDNAVKYTPPPGTVRIDAGVDGTHARITVSDTGLGVPPQETQRIFERFYRGRNAHASTGTGLGLAIARWIADQHNGTIEYAPGPDGGSRFSILLPLAPHSQGESVEAVGDQS